MFREVLLDETMELYQDYYDRASGRSIYHHPQYLQAEEKAEDYKIYLYIYEKNNQYVILPSVKKRINDIDIFVQEEEEYYDLVTPHEYSGVLSNVYDLDLFQEFYNQLESFCINHNIIFQFIRFNPYSDEYKSAKKFDIQLADRQNWVDCSTDVLEHYQKRRAVYVRAAVKKGMECREVEKNDENIECFYHFYVKAMERLSAKKFLYFNMDYFRTLCRNEFTKLFFIIDGSSQTILSGTLILCDADHKRLYYHLSFRNAEAGNVRSMEYMIYAISEWAKVNGYESVHLGGGSSSLHQFKDGCTDKRVEYYVGSRIYSPSKYKILADKFCKKYPEQKDTMFLPIYRSKE